MKGLSSEIVISSRNRILIVSDEASRWTNKVAAFQNGMLTRVQDVCSLVITTEY